MKQKTKKINKIALYVFFTLILFALNFSEANAEGAKGLAGMISDGVKNTMLLAFNYLLYGVWLLVTFFIWIAGLLFDWAINPANMSGIINSPAIYNGWMIVRDFLNLSFILVLLFSAFSTVFQIDKYHLMKKNILLMVVLMALLVNFSFPVARFIIDTTNVTMYFFVDQAFPGYNYANGGMSASFLDQSKLVELVVPNGVSSVEGDADLTIKLLLLIVFSFILAVTMIAMAGIFLVRIIALALIIVFAPLGFIAPIFPGFSKMSEWWKYLFNYALVGPVMMFMLLLSLRLMEQLGSMETIGSASIGELAGGYSATGMSDFIAKASYFFIPIIILWSSMKIASSMGVYGASAITGWSVKAAKWSAFNLTGARAGLHWANREIAKKAPILSPLAWKDGWKKRQDRLNSEASALSSGKMENVFERGVGMASSINPFYGIRRIKKGFGKGGFSGVAKELWRPSDMDHTDRDYVSRANEASKRAKDIEGVNDNADYVLGRLESGIERKDSIETHAALKVLAKNNDLNELMIKERGEWDPDKLVEVLVDIYKKAGSSEKDIAKNLMGLSDIGAGNANFGYYKMGYYDEKAKDFVVNNNSSDRANSAAGKLMNFEPQARQRQLHPDSMFKYDKDGNVTEFSETGVALLNAFSGDDLAQADRSRGDLKVKFADAAEQITKNTNKKLIEQFDKLGDVGKQYVYMSKHMKDGESKAEALAAAKKEI
jgi:hypothetical protein